MAEIFNYIVPIYNKEDILPETLEGIEKCAGMESKIIMIVDGCTDRSEEIVDEFMKNSSHKCEKILMPNVHMLLSVNAGLKSVQKGFSVIMQDDIILEDLDIEIKVSELYKRIGENLGVISFRYASNLKGTSLKSTIRNSFKKMVEVFDQIQGPDDYASYPVGDYGKFYPRMCAINGPNVIPWNLFSKLGLFDENLAPYGYDDPDYCVSALKIGFLNGLFPVHYKSEIEWGGTRRSKEFISEANRILKRNRCYVWQKHGSYINQYLKSEKYWRNLDEI